MSRVPFRAFSILCRDALILGILGDLLKGPILSNSPFMGSDSEAPGWGGQFWGYPASEGPQWSLGVPQVLMSSPYKGEGRGIAMLNLLKTLSQSIAPSMADMWELKIPLLVKYLEGQMSWVHV